ncbi:MAG: glycogen synthase [Chloroflexi bacterium]|nr:glycogen synthase [Chloroflexota bacterium]
MKPKLNVLFLAAEADPFIKIGGLGDYAGSLPLALHGIVPTSEDETGIDIRLVIPFYGAIQQKQYPLKRVAAFEVPHAGGSLPAEALMLEMRGLPVYFISGSMIPADAPVYTSDPAEDGRKFTFFSLCALELARSLEWPPDIVHANDWHTAPAVYALSLIQRDSDPVFNNAAALLGLHNLPYLGAGAEQALDEFGLPPAENSALPGWAKQMPLPLGLLAADHIVAPSPTYAQEILTPEFGSGLHSFLRQRKQDISGILNGIDVNRWDPRTDEQLKANYSHEDLTPRKVNKTALQQEFNLEVDADIPLIIIISRMDKQKGIDLVPDALRHIAGQRWQAVILGTGDPVLEAAVRGLENNLPDQVRVAVRFDAALSRRMYGAADIILIPSRYEPCGLNQMIGMRYGVVPVARATGGLKDTIQDYDLSEESTGFLFDKESASALSEAIRRALAVYENRDAWTQLQQRCMQQDFSWDRFARQYLTLYRSLARAKAARQPGSSQTEV